jgi:hypothetical protein
LPRRSQILSLTLGPLTLDLLGLVVHLNQVVLTITAQQGPGNLLGNLLCAVANLLNGGNPLGSLANLLNEILSILNSLQVRPSEGFSETGKWMPPSQHARRTRRNKRT